MLPEIDAQSIRESLAAEADGSLAGGRGAVHFDVHLSQHALHDAQSAARALKNIGLLSSTGGIKKQSRTPSGAGVRMKIDTMLHRKFVDFNNSNPRR